MKKFIIIAESKTEKEDNCLFKKSDVTVIDSEKPCAKIAEEFLQESLNCSSGQRVACPYEKITVVPLSLDNAVSLDVKSAISKLSKANLEPKVPSSGVLKEWTFYKSLAPTDYSPSLLIEGLLFDGKKITVEIKGIDSWGRVVGVNDVLYDLEEHSLNKKYKSRVIPELRNFFINKNKELLDFSEPWPPVRLKKLSEEDFEVLYDYHDKWGEFFKKGTKLRKLDFMLDPETQRVLTNWTVLDTAK